MRYFWPAIATAALCLFALALWMNRWDYHGTIVDLPLRTNRITGSRQIFSPYGEWIPIGDRADIREAAPCGRLLVPPVVSPDSFRVYRARCDSLQSARSQ